MFFWGKLLERSFPQTLFKNFAHFFCRIVFLCGQFEQSSNHHEGKCGNNALEEPRISYVILKRNAFPTKISKPFDGYGLTFEGVCCIILR